MALAFQNVPVPLGGGMDQTSAEPFIQQGKTNQVINGVYNKLGGVQKRNGFYPLTNSMQRYGVQQLATFNDQLLAADWSGFSLWSWSDVLKRFVSSGPVSPCVVTTDGVYENVTSTASPTSCVINGMVVYAWLDNLQDSSTVLQEYVGNIYVAVFDANTGYVILPAAAVNAPVPNGNSGIKLTTVGNYACLTFTDTSGSLQCSVIDCQPTTIQAYGAPYVNDPLKMAQSRARADGTNQLPGKPNDADTDGTFLYFSWLDATSTAGTTSTGIAQNMLIFNPAAPEVDNQSGIELISGSVAHYTASAGRTLGLSVASTGFTQGKVWSSIGTRENNVGAQSNVVWANQYDISDIYNKTNFTSSIKHTVVSSSFNNPAVVSATQPIAFTTSSAGVLFNSSDASVDTATYQPIAVQNKTIQKLAVVGASDGTETLVPGLPRTAHGAQMTSKPWLWKGTSGSLDRVNGSYVGNENHVYCVAYAGSNLNATQFVFDVGGSNTVTNQLGWKAVSTFGARKSALGLRGLAQWFNGTGGITVVGVNALSGVSLLSSSSTGTTFYTVGRIDQTSLNTGRLGLLGIEMEFGPQRALETAELNNDLLISAGTPQLYDGQNTYETGFLLFPDELAGSQTSALAGSIPKGIHQYQITYEWEDPAGNTHRSQPSLPVVINNTSDNAQNTLFIPELWLTSKQPLSVGNTLNVGVVVYRTVAGGNVFFRITPDVVPLSLLNTPGQPGLSFVDSQNDAITTAGQVYTQGGSQLPNTNPPSARYTCNWNNRQVLAGLDEPTKLWFSQPAAEAVPTEWNDELSIYVEEGGDITAIANMDEKLIIFKQNKVFFIEGNGPGIDGGGSDISYATEVPVEGNGCVNHRSIVLTGDGLWYRSQNSLFLVARSLDVINVGFPVQDWLDLYPYVSSALELKDVQQVRFTCNQSMDPKSSGITLVYDAVAKSWSAFQLTDPLTGRKNVSVTAACSWNSKKLGPVYVVATGDGTVAYERAGWYADGATLTPKTFVSTTAESGWVSVNDINGFQRVQRVATVSECFDPVDLTVSVQQDYVSGTYSQTGSYSGTTSDFNNPGSASYTDLHVRASNQKCTAVRVKVQDTFSTDPSNPSVTGQGLSFDRVTLRAAPKAGTNKINPLQRR